LKANALYKTATQLYHCKILNHFFGYNTHRKIQKIKAILQCNALLDNYSNVKAIVYLAVALQIYRLFRQKSNVL